jgi:hypothetical protein
LPEIKFCQCPAAPRPFGDRVGVAAVVTNQLVMAGIELQIRAALIARKAVFIGGCWLIFKICI